MNGNRHGFTLIEIIGVLAIIAILASALAPNIAREITRSIADAEDRQLEAISKALIRYVETSHVIPGTAAGEWDVAVAPFLTVPLQKILFNKNEQPRVLIIRPTNDIPLPAPALPYVQSTRFINGTLPTSLPLNARMLLVSNFQPAALQALAQNAQFDAVWNQQGAIPNGYTENDKLRIARITFAGCFHPVQVSFTGPAVNATWAFDALGMQSPAANAYFLLHGTLVKLGNPGLQQTIIITGQKTLTFDGTNWSVD